MGDPVSSRTFINYTDNLQQLGPVHHEQNIFDNFKSWKVTDLRTWLGLRGIRCADSTKEDMVRLAFFTWKLQIPLNPTELETQAEAAVRLEKLLEVNGCPLPKPKEVKGWTTDLQYLPTVTHFDICSYIIDSPGPFPREKLKAFKSLDAYNYAVNGWVQQIHIFEASEDLYFICAKVKPSQHSTAPYEPWAVLGQDGSVHAGRCDCMAGLGEACSHIAALLYKALAAAELGLNSPEASTSRACVWNNAFCEKVPPRKIRRIDFSKPQYNKVRQRKKTQRIEYVESDSDSDGSLWDTISEVAPNAAVLLCLPKQASENNNAENHQEQLITEQAPEIPFRISTLDGTDQPEIAALNPPNNPETPVNHFTPALPEKANMLENLLIPTPAAKSKTHENTSNLTPPDRQNVLENLPTLPISNKPKTIEEIIAEVPPGADYFHLVKDSISEEESEWVYNQTKNQHHNDLWHDMRRHRITATRTDGVLKFMRSNRRHPSATLMRSLMGQNTYVSEEMQYGTRNESKARDRYIQDEMIGHDDLKVSPCGLRIPPGDAHLGASPDGIVTCSCCEPRLLEIKCAPAAYKKGKGPDETGTMDYLTYHGLGRGTLKRTHKHFTQVQSQMGVTGYTQCDFVVWNPYGMVTCPIAFEEDFWCEVKRASESFFVQFLLPVVLGMQDGPLPSTSLQSLQQLPSTSSQRVPPVPSTPAASLPKPSSSQHLLEEPKHRRRPKKYLCTVCRGIVASRAVACDSCNRWTHFRCVGLTGKEEFLQTSDWYCGECAG